MASHLASGPGDFTLAGDLMLAISAASTMNTIRLHRQIPFALPRSSPLLRGAALKGNCFGGIPSRSGLGSGGRGSCPIDDRLCHNMSEKKILLHRSLWSNLHAHHHSSSPVELSRTKATVLGSLFYHPKSDSNRPPSRTIQPKHLSYPKIQ
eukprot:3463518-Rhodomonas_salina.2